MDFNHLLAEQGIDSRETRVLVMRHVPKEPELKRVLPWLAVERPETYNAYQQTQSENAERQLASAAYLASFVGIKPKEALFVGLYKVAGQRPIIPKRYWKLRGHGELRELGMVGWIPTRNRRHILLFDLRLMPQLQEMKGRLVVGWNSERAWTQKAGPGRHQIRVIHEESVLDKGMPSWNELLLSWEELQHLPGSWAAKLAEWRGIYFILNAKDGKGYVGSAYGERNLFSRWKNYSESGDGGNKLLKSRNPKYFKFSILELVSPTMKAEDVIALEGTWKERLHTRTHGLNIN